MKFLKSIFDVFYFDREDAIDRFVITEYKPIDRVWAKRQLLSKLDN